jgi:hypothetical protein
MLCHWALSGDDDSCHPFYYSTYEEADSEKEGSKLKIKVRTLSLMTYLSHSLVVLILIGYFPVTPYCRYSWNTYHVDFSN